MKRSLVLILAVMFVLGMVSCKKDYTCTCDTPAGQISYEIMDAKKKDAEDACNAYEILGTDITCSL